MRLMIGLLILALWSSGMAVAYVSHETRELYREIGEEKAQLDALKVRWGQLTLERGALAAPMRLNRFAAEIGLNEPTEEQLQVLPEVRP